MNDHGEWMLLKLTELGEALQRTAEPLSRRFRLRTASLATHLHGIAALYNASFALDGDDAITPEEISQMALHPGIEPDGTFLAMDGDVEVGLCVGSIEVPGPDDPGGRGYIQLVVVRPEYQRQGIGRALLNEALKWLKERGVSVVGAVVQDTTPLAILQRYGFSLAGPLPDAVAQ
jgi:ribosomal protein S18 acetylase RimI-like enzyme